MDDILSRLSELPPLPETILKLVSVLNDPASTVSDVVETIRYDQAVTTQMLRLCNSAYYGLSREVHSLDEAVLFLGIMKVFQLAMAVHSNSLLSRRQLGYGMEAGVLWRHSVGVALASVAFAERTGLNRQNLVFTAGLLHDVGKVVLNECVAQEFGEIVQRVTQEKISFVEAERQVLGFSHSEIGARVAEQWRLPEAMVRCIRHHHEPDAVSPPDALVDVVHLADCVCMMLGVGLGSDGLCYRASPAVMDRHRQYESDLELVGAHMLVELKRVERTFSDGPAVRTTRPSATKQEVS